MRADRLLLEGIRLALRPPYIVLLVVVLFVGFVSSRGSLADPDDLGAAFLVPTALLWVVTRYIEMAVILAVAAGAPTSIAAELEGVRPGAADPWVRKAFRRKAFIRFLLALLFSVLLVGIGTILLVVPGLIAAGVVTLAPMAAVLEYATPGEAVRRSIELTEPARLTISIVYVSVILVPALALPLVQGVVGDPGDPRAVAARLVAEFLSLVGFIALTKAYLALGGTTIPRSARTDWIESHTKQN